MYSLHAKKQTLCVRRWELEPVKIETNIKGFWKQKM